MKILLARPRGFCAGVDRAIDIVRLALEKFGPPVYVRHEIVHNIHVVNELRKNGAIFVENLSDIPEGSVTIFSAHGVAPAVRHETQERHLKVIDATCPLVTKVHSEAKKYEQQGLHIVLIGHRNHVEVEGTVGEAPHSISLAENLEDIKRLTIPENKRVAVLTQTTLSVEDAQVMIAALRERFPDLIQPKANDICYATTNRQKAVKALAKQCDLILVIGSHSSSNSNRLVEVAHSCGTRSFLIDDACDLTHTALNDVKTLGLTAGASAPEFVIQNILAWLKKHYETQVDTVDVGSEEVSFSLTKELFEIS